MFTRSLSCSFFDLNKFVDFHHPDILDFSPMPVLGLEVDQSTGGEREASAARRFRPMKSRIRFFARRGFTNASSS